MGVNDTAVGSALIIPDSLLNDLGKVDEKIKNIQQASEQTAKIFNGAFQSMSLNTGNLLANLQQVINQLGNIGQAAQTASSATQNMGSGLGTAAQGATNLGTSVTGVVEAINRMIGQLQKTGQVGSSSLMAAKLAADKLMEAMQFKNTGNIAAIKDEILNINKTLKDTESALSMSEQQALVERKRLLQEELKEAERTQNERAVNLQRVLDRMVGAEQSYQRQVQQNNKKTAEQYKSQNYASNTTYSGSLAFADNANTINRRTQAIKYLTEARNALSKTDADYANKLATLNAKIKELNAANRQAIASSQELGNSHRKLMDTAGQLQRAFALLFSVSQVRGYIDTIAKVRGEFELQQKSLQSILQNKTQADTIFNQTMALALDSPFRAKQLITYTKQLAAYRIENEKLYDTTKRLADVSAGLGVDMQRLILAYGQVKAAAYLRGSEVRQFTEAGVNMYGELQKLFKERDQADYTTAQIVDMISKRMVTFEDVEQVFHRLTDQGGLFYNMQHIQVETLSGKIGKLKDAIDQMMNSIGKENEGLFKGSLDAATALVQNWETVATVGRHLIEIIVAMSISSKVLGASFGYSAAKAAKTTKYFGLLKGSMVALQTQFAKLKTVFMTSLPLLGITAAIELFGHLISVQREYNKAQKEAENKYYQGQVRTSEIENLAVTIDDKTSKPKIKEALNALVKEMNNEGFNIEIKVNLSEEEAKQQYDELLEQHKQYLDDMLELDYQYNLDKQKNSWFWQTDSDEANEDITEAYQRALATVSQIRTELARVADKGTGLDEAMRNELEELERGVTESGSIEAIKDYYRKLLDFLDKIRSSSTRSFTTSSGIAFSSTTTTFAGLQSGVLKGAEGVSQTLDAAGRKMEEKIKEIFDAKFNFKNYDNAVKVAMANNFAISRGWSLDLVQQIMAPLYDIDFTPKQKHGDNGGVSSGSDMENQRDIWAERISLIKELNQEYEKLNKVMGGSKAAETVMKRYASVLKDVGMPKGIIGDNFLPNKKNTAKALQEVAKEFRDFRKKIGAEKDAWQLLDQDDVEKAKERLDEIREYVQNLFSQKDLHLKLSNLGLSDAQIEQMFGFSTKSFEDIRKAIEEKYTSTYGVDKSKWGKDELGKDVFKQYEDEMKDLDKRIYNDQVSQAQELLKAYKTQLSDQLQLDRWYYEERRKIQENEQLARDPELQKQMQANLYKQYAQKTDENTWKQFQNSDFYIRIFENLDTTSTRVLNAMQEKLASLRDSLKNLSPEQLKQIVSQQEKIDNLLIQRNPFKGLVSGLKEYIKFAGQRKQLEEDYLRSLGKQEFLENQKKIQTESVESAKQRYDLAVKLFGTYSPQAAEAERILKIEREKLETVLDEAVAQGKITKELRDQILNGENFGKETAARFSKIGGYLNEFSSGITEIASNLENVFGTMSAGMNDAISSISEVAGGLGNAFAGAGRALANPLDIGGWVQGISGLAKSIGALFNIKDKKLQREIERQQELVGALQRSYGKLKTSMDEAWRAADVIQANKNTEENIRSQIAAYEAMIKAEGDKKKADKDKIKEWNEAIEDLEEELDELGEQTREAFGGFGSEANYKSAAQEFIDAWVDAFNETGDTLQALEDTFDDYFSNMLKKQLMQRAAHKYLEPLFRAIDDAVYDEDTESLRSLEDFKAHLADIGALSDVTFEGLDDYLKSIIKAIDYTPSGTSGALSKLQQGIQSLTESTGQALESLLNSIRFFVAQQSADVSAIRALLQQSAGIELPSQSDAPMLTELRAQTVVLKSINDKFESIVKSSGHPKSGAGIKVFID